MITLQSMTAQNSAASKLMATSAERLTSGKKVNSAADNAAAIAILDKLEARGRAFDASIGNANSGISMLNVADAASEGVNDGLQRLRELAVQSSNGILSDEDRDNINAEAEQIQSEISRLTTDTEFNGKKVLASNDTLNIQLGSDAASSTVIRTSNLDAELSNSGLGTIDLGSQGSSQDAIGAIDDMIAATSKARSDFGAQTNRLTSSVSNLQDQSIAVSASRSQLGDADYAKEAADFTSGMLQEKVSFAVQAQANANAGQVLALLK